MMVLPRNKPFFFRDFVYVPISLVRLVFCEEKYMNTYNLVSLFGGQ